MTTEEYKEYGKKHNLNLEGKKEEEIKHICEKHGYDTYYESIYVQGEEEEIDCCSECASYTVGEYRCSCGNVRISLTIEGNLQEGYYYYYESC